MAEKRVAKEWKLNPSIKVESFDLNEVNSTNLINQLLKLKQSDITYSFMMNIFGSFDEKYYVILMIYLKFQQKHLNSLILIKIKWYLISIHLKQLLDVGYLMYFY